jgi:hypothetical protein
MDFESKAIQGTRFVTEFQHHKDAYISIEESTKDQVFPQA